MNKKGCPCKYLGRLSCSIYFGEDTAMVKCMTRNDTDINSEYFNMFFVVCLIRSKTSEAP